MRLDWPAPFVICFVWRPAVPLNIVPFGHKICAQIANFKSIGLLFSANPVKTEIKGKFSPARPRNRRHANAKPAEQKNFTKGENAHARSDVTCFNRPAQLPASSSFQKRRQACSCRQSGVNRSTTHSLSPSSTSCGRRRSSSSQLPRKKVSANRSRRTCPWATRARSSVMSSRRRRRRQVAAKSRVPKKNVPKKSVKILRPASVMRRCVRSVSGSATLYEVDMQYLSVPIESGALATKLVFYDQSASKF